MIDLKVRRFSSLNYFRMIPVYDLFITRQTKAKKVIDSIILSQSNYHFIEFMACPEGCLGGGGNPDTNQSRASA